MLKCPYVWTESNDQTLFLYLLKSCQPIFVGCRVALRHLAFDKNFYRHHLQFVHW